MKTCFLIQNAGRFAAFGFLLGIAGCDQPLERKTPLAEKTESSPSKVSQREVEVCFVLDTTGSMGGLIEGAKKKIWSVANEIVTANPGAKVSMGLIGYRDRGDEYITKRFPLSQDLDSLYEHLLSFKADGGGDEPESVNQALAEAVNLMEWSNSSKVLRMIFLVGDAPPHMDYANDVHYQETCKKALAKGVTINSIQCGTSGSTARIWREIAGNCDGKYVALQQDGNMQVVSTPMDEKLAELNRQVGKTLVPYGSSEQKRSVADKQSRSEDAPAGVTASRLSYNSNTKKAVQGQGDLIDDLKSKRIKLETVSKEELPSQLQGKSGAEVKALLERTEKEREVVQQEIVKVSKERDAWLAEDKKKRESAGAEKDSFDSEVNAIILDQSKKVFRE